MRLRCTIRYMQNRKRHPDADGCSLIKSSHSTVWLFQVGSVLESTTIRCGVRLTIVPSSPRLVRSLSSHDLDVAEIHSTITDISDAILNIDNASTFGFINIAMPDVSTSALLYATLAASTSLLSPRNQHQRRHMHIIPPWSKSL